MPAAAIAQHDTPHAIPVVDNLAKQLGGSLGVVTRGVRSLPFEFNARPRAGLAQHGVAESDCGERGRVEHCERMERIALDAATLGGRHQEAMIKMRVVGSQHGPFAPVAANPAADEPKQLAHRLLLAQRIAVRVSEINAGDLERSVLDPRRRVRNDIPALDFLDVEPALGPGETHGRNLQHRVDILVETTGFEIDDNWEKAAKSGAHFAHRRPYKPRDPRFCPSIHQRGAAGTADRASSRREHIADCAA